MINKILIGLIMVFACSGCMHRKQKIGNVLRLAMGSKIKGFDPATMSDLSSHEILAQICEPLFQYAYLKRPYKLEPLVAESLPNVSEDGLIYTVQIKKGIRFSNNVCFEKTGGVGRELTAEDFVYGIKRVANIHIKSTGWWVFDGRIEGLNEFRDYTKSVKKNQVDYTKPVKGLTALGPTTLLFKLTKPCPVFFQLLAHSYALPIAREADIYYGEELINHPVGTGPYQLATWRRGQKIILTKNQNFRKIFYPTQGMPEDSAAGLLADAGQVIPFIEKIEFNIITESQPMWLNFIRGYLDASGIPKDNFDKVIGGNFKLNKRYFQRGIELTKASRLDFYYLIFNFENSFLKNNKKVRQAIRCAFNKLEYIKLFTNDRAVAAHGPIPPGISGYDPDQKIQEQLFNLSRARELLKEAGYPDGQGIPRLRYMFVAGTDGRQRAQFFKRSMEKIKIDIEMEGLTWPEFLKRQKKADFELCVSGWIADYPDAENFHQLFFGPNKPPASNAGSYANPVFDSLYKIISVIPISPKRDSIIKQMTGILQSDCAAVFVLHSRAFGLRYNWVKNYKYGDTSLMANRFKYYRLDLQKRMEWIMADRKILK